MAYISLIHSNIIIPFSSSMQQTLSSDQRLSEVVRALRFPLILLVVFIHVPLASGEGQVLPLDLPGSSYSWYQYISRALSFILGDMAVPMFFLFSGYYMFTKPKAWGTMAVYTGEMKKRWRTLILPYIIWCTASLLADQALALAKGEPLPWTSLGASLSRLSYTFVLGPENFPLWYVRDLIILTFLAPVIDWVSRRAPWLLLLLFLLYLANCCPWEIPAPRGVIYFTLGAILGSRRIDMVALAERGRVWVLPLSVVATLLLPFCPEAGVLGALHLLYVPLAMAGALCLGGWVYDRMPKLHHFHLTMEKYVFFIYVAHEVLILSAVRGFLYRHGWLETVWGYFLCGGVVLGICLIGYAILSRWARRSLAISLGGRL